MEVYLTAMVAGGKEGGKTREERKGRDELMEKREGGGRGNMWRG